MFKNLGLKTFIVGFCLSLSCLVMAVEVVFQIGVYKLPNGLPSASEGEFILKELDGKVIGRRKFTTDGSFMLPEVRFSNVTGGIKPYHIQAESPDHLCKGTMDNYVVINDTVPVNKFGVSVFMQCQ